MCLSVLVVPTLAAVTLNLAFLLVKENIYRKIFFLSCRIHFYEPLTSPGSANGSFFGVIFPKTVPGKSVSGRKKARERKREREAGGGSLTSVVK